MFLLSASVCFSALSKNATVTVTIGNIGTKKCKEDIYVTHIAVEPATNSTRLINRTAETEIQNHPLKDTPFRDLMLQAKEGDIQAQYLLACKYDTGNGVRKDQKKAKKWYFQAAKQGDMHTQFVIGSFFEPRNRLNASRWYLKSAQQGYAKAQCKMAYQNKFGYGVECDYEEAFNWYLKAIKQDSVEALINIGLMYYHGEGTEQNYREAYQCFIKSLDSQIDFFMPFLYYRLGYMHQQGFGTEVNYEEAIQLYEKAIEDNYSGFKTYALYRLGNMHENGLGVETSPEKAILLYKKAAKDHDCPPDVFNRLGYLYEHGLGTEYDTESAKWYDKATEANKKLAESSSRNKTRQLQSNAVIEDFDTLSIQELVKEAKKGNAEAQYQLGNRYSFGHDGVKENDKEAFRWYLKAAEQDYSDAQSSLVHMYCDGDGTEQNYIEAMKWARRAAENGNAWVLIDIGLMYANGQGVNKDVEEAEKWFAKFTESQQIKGLQVVGFLRLGHSYASGDDIEKNHQKAFEWMLKAANVGDPGAQYYIGQSYLEGRGVEKNLEKAYDWFRKSADSGHAAPGTYYNLAMMHHQGQNTNKDLVEAYKYLLLASKPYFNMGQVYPGFDAQRSSPNNIHEKPKKELTSKQMQIQIQMLERAKNSGVYLPDLPDKIDEIKSQMTPEEVATAEKEIEEYLRIQEEKDRKEVERINAEYRQKAGRGN